MFHQIRSRTFLIEFFAWSITTSIDLDRARVEVGALFDLARVEADAAGRDDVEADEHGAHAAETHNTA